MPGILVSLHQPEAQDRFDQVDQAYRTTFEWLLDPNETRFIKWLGTGQGIFWISGKPGSGKLKLMKYAATDPCTFENLLANDPRNRWIWAEFFFSERGKKPKKTLEGLLCRILFELLSKETRLIEFVADVIQDDTGIQELWSLISLEAALLSIIEQKKRLRSTYPCLSMRLTSTAKTTHGTHWRLLETLQKLTSSTNGIIVKVLVCVSSRPGNLFEDYFQDYPGFHIYGLTQNDLQLYVHGRINTYLASREDLLSDDDSIISINKTKDEVIRRAQGVFLWVRLVMTDLIEALIDGDSPGQLSQNFHIREAFAMLQIALATLTPLSNEEFFQAVQYTCAGPQGFDVKPPTHPEMERRLFSRCRGLLEIRTVTHLPNSSGKVVQFLHQPVKDFLTTSSSFETIRAKANFDPSDNGHVFLIKFRDGQQLLAFKNLSLIHATEALADLRWSEMFYQARMAEETTNSACTTAVDALSDIVDAHELASVYLLFEN
ncbi:hypothetical protein OEA41_005001 [Lepraria neglecta]|uniref:NACHT domain-containing protein n=1 Tax=Lepraria neglecta TaxID=209136 RepID=A0AAE0DIR8_9LECA|nr:hypothetical protein OEA41_005001 [Lepraria neglecta]